MKLCVFLEWRSYVSQLMVYGVRLMSDYEVTLVNDSMQEFYVWFYGPSESTQPQGTCTTSARAHKRGPT
jgi:hypothetical protein